MADFYNDNNCQKFYIKAVGVTFENRQRTISRLEEGQELQFVAEPDNPYDRNAVEIKTLSGESVGHVSRNNNENISFNLRMNRGTYKLYVSKIHEGGFDKNYGCNIEVNYYPNAGFSNDESEYIPQSAKEYEIMVNSGHISRNNRHTNYYESNEESYSSKKNSQDWMFE